MDKFLKRKQKAEITNNKTLLSSVCIDLASLYLEKGQFNGAIREYKIVSAIYKEQNKMLDYACANRMIGEAYTNLQMFNEALKHVMIYLSVAQKEQNKMEEQRALATMGHIYLTKSLCLEEESNSKSLNMAAKNFLASLNVCEKLVGISKHEHMDMMARLFSNLGIVKEAQGDFAKGIELVKKSINICKKYDLYEQLERGYTTLSSLYSKCEDFSNAITNINLSMEVAGRLPDKISLICSSLLSKGEILVKMSDLQGAKRILYKAYKYKTPIDADRVNIERNLRIVTAMNYAEESLLIASDTDYRGKKKLYERLGDGACHFKNYNKAIYYYKIMLEYATKNGEEGRELSPCYNSLAQTYHDNREYDNALEYYRKDLDVCMDNLKDKINTLLQIIETMDLAGKEDKETITVFEQARAECIDNPKLHAKVLNRFICFLKKRHKFSEAIDLERNFEELGVDGSQSDEEDSQDVTDNIGDEVDLSNITDLSSSDDEKDQSTRSVRKRHKTLAIKKNAKGESQLHVAAINGNAMLVKKLLEQGHVVNIRDNAGWLPIHEACICGHLEIVKMLIEKGAAINDRGGTLCNGITPLHDAASNGHLEVIGYMLDKGASPLAKNDNGETPLYILKNWREDETLDETEQNLFENIVERMKKALSKAGQEEIPVKRKSNEAFVLVDEDTFSQPSSIHTVKPPRRLTKTYKKSENANKKFENANKIDLRRNVNAGENSDDEDLTTSLATNEYKDAIDCLKSSNGVKSASQCKKRKSIDVKSAHLLPDEVDADNWLIDDLPSQTTKKRRNDGSFSLLCLKGPKTRSDEIEFDGIDENLEPQFSKRKKQSTLLKSGFTKNRSSSPLTPNVATKISSSSSPLNLYASAEKRGDNSNSNFAHKLNRSNNSLQNISLDSIDSNISANQSVIGKRSVFIDVRIEGKLFRISVTTNELETLSIKWLADEATNRYYKKEAIKPKIEMETKNGASLCDEDFLYTLFPVGTSQCEELQAKVITWSIPPLNERYRDVCTYLGVGVNETLLETFEVATETLKLFDRNLRSAVIPIFKALNRQSNLYELDVSGNLFGDKALETLCDTMPSLPNLSSLNLSANHLTCLGLQLLVGTLEKSSKSLKDLNLSYNPLNNESFRHICKISEMLDLNSLHLSACGFSKGIFDVMQNRGCKLILDNVKIFDVSFNDLIGEEFSILLNSLRVSNVEVLNFGENNIENDDFLRNLVTFFCSNDDNLVLRKLDLSRCHVTDSSIEGLINVLGKSENIDEVNLSLTNITVSSFKKLLEETCVKSLVVMGCDNLKDEEHLFMDEWKFQTVKPCANLWTSFDYVRDFIQCDTLLNMFKRQCEMVDVNGLNDGMFRLQISSSSGSSN